MKPRWGLLAKKTSSMPAVKRRKNTPLKQKGPLKAPCCYAAAGRLRVWRSLGSRLTVFVDIQWLGLTFDNAFVDHHFTHLGLRGNFVHGVEQYAFEDRTQATRTGLALQCPLGHFFLSVATELEVYTFHFEQLGIL